MPTITDVARAAGVSIATVSHVMNESRPVLPETRRRVLEAVNELSYRPHGIARSLRRAKTGTIGVVIADITNPFFADLVRGIETAIRNNSEPHTLILCNTEEDGERERQTLDVLQEKRVDGIIVAPVRAQPSAALRIAAAAVPLVCVDRKFDEPLSDAVVLNNREAARQIVAHLLRQGNRSIGMLRAALWTDTMEERAKGFRDALQAAGLSADAAPVVTCESRVDSAQAGALQMLDLDPRPDAVFTTNNFATLGLVQALRLRGLCCPEDICLGGFDDFHWADDFSPRLTVIWQPAERMGQDAAGLLLDRMSRRRTGKPMQLVLDGALVVRESCGTALLRPGRLD